MKYLNSYLLPLLLLSAHVTTSIAQSPHLQRQAPSMQTTGSHLFLSIILSAALVKYNLKIRIYHPHSRICPVYYDKCRQVKNVAFLAFYIWSVQYDQVQNLFEMTYVHAIRIHERIF
ncbi:hypothetical protein BX661DRAFT_18445 [Kickxella alabastrina]|uniref:uncharacterized protein n=1 Tax=Kickxella alabastrina TaxID=61397 RepID=UPI00222028A7|nr:uncharacterized protein BX661DRAFT_18445 [Kickxella alabastrina]KAI7827876.1 hypothetical protein BX661DRAFT_18445 [Kickxella alabastrina]